MDIINTLWVYLTPVITALLTYFIAVKGKQKDVDIEKTKQLNTVLSNLLDTWHYLGRLEDLSDLHSSDFQIPFEFIPQIVIHSNLLDDTTFETLDTSIESLKKYDPITYYNLSGMGKKFEFINNNLIQPFLSAETPTKLEKKIPETYIKDTISEIEEYLIIISKQLGYKTYKHVKKAINTHIDEDTADLKETLLLNYYELASRIAPHGEEPASFEAFTESLEDPEIIQQMRQQFSHLDQNSIGDILTAVTKNPLFSDTHTKNKTP